MPTTRRFTVLMGWLGELSLFAWKQAHACLFAGSFFMLLFLSSHIPLGSVSRYDFLFVAALGIQAVFLALKWETWEEVRVIFLFHLIGFVLEVFKTHPAIGSWSYPGPGIFKVATVPLYSGFMYSAVGSYINQAWKIFNLRLTSAPPYKLIALLSLLIYANFFTHHFMPDLRWWLSAATVSMFWRTRVHFTVAKTPRRMPLVLSFVLIGFFIWVAENISTLLGAWQYPDQAEQWVIVGLGKISSWCLLVIISFNIIAGLKHLQAKRYQDVKIPNFVPQRLPWQAKAGTGKA